MLHVAVGVSDSVNNFSDSYSRLFSPRSKGNQDTVVAVKCVGNRLLLNTSLFSMASAPTLHALVWTCRHIFSPPAEPKKRVPPV